MYSTDEYGNIISEYDGDLSEDLSLSEFDDSDLDLSDSGDYITGIDVYDYNGNFVGNFTGSGNNLILPPSDNDNFLDFDSLAETLALVPEYTIYPSTEAVNVFSGVLNGLDYNFGYVILAGSDTNDMYLYYSKDFSVSGQIINLFSPVTRCRYYRYRPTSSSNYVYTYSVQEVDTSTFNLSNQLIYTNIIDGYPDLLPYKRNENFSLLFIMALSLLVLVFSFFRNLDRRDKKK